MPYPFDESWEQLDELVGQCQLADDDQRKVILAAVRLKNPQLAIKLEKTLKVLDETTCFLEDPQIMWQEDGDELPAGIEIGAFRVLGRLGAGGMGVVYRAERADGAYHQDVAIKVLSSKWLSGAAKSRFHLERHLLAKLDHPGISRLIDGGDLDTGEPYLVMEYVDGQAIDVYCDQRKLGIPERIELIIQVSEALDHAHRHRVIHRDIKPANLLVDRDGRARLIDFGIARFEDAPAEYANLTKGAIMLTPAYACPEQARGLSVSTASDTYSLGAVLYQLVIGSPSLIVTTEDMVGVLNAICDQSLKRFRTVLRSLDPPELDHRSELRSVNRRQMLQSCTGDLEAIVLKAMSKEPERRYASMAAFRDDLSNHLMGKPVTARSDSAWYRFSKLVKRYPWTTALSALAFTALLVLTIGLAVQLNRVKRERLRSERTAQFMVDMFRNASPEIGGAANIRAVDVLRQAASRLRYELQDEPLVRAQLLDTISTVSRHLRNLELGADTARAALDIKRAYLPDDDPELVVTLTNLGFYLTLKDGMREGSVFLDQAEDILNRSGIQDHQIIDLLIIRAFALQTVGRLKEAESIYLSVLDRVSLDDPRSIGLKETALMNLGWLLLDEGNIPGAEPFFQRALASRVQSLGEKHPLTLLCKQGIVHWLVEAERYQDAQTLGAALLADFDAAYGTEDKASMAVLASLADVARNIGDMDLAFDYLSHSKELVRKTYSESSFPYANILITESHFSESMGQYTRSLELAREAHSVALALEDNQLILASALTVQAQAQQLLGQFEGAENDYLAALDIYAEQSFPDRPVVIQTKSKLAWLWLTTGRVIDSIGMYQEILAILEDRSGIDFSSYHQIRQGYGWALHADGRTDEARIVFRDVLNNLKRLMGEKHASVARAKHSLGWLLFEADELAEAIELTRSAILTWTELRGPRHPDLAWSQNNLALMLHSNGTSQEALELIKTSLETRIETLGKSHTLTIQSHANLFEIQKQMGPMPEAYTTGIELADIYEEMGDKRMLAVILPQLVEMASSLGRLDEASRWKHKANDL